MADSRFKRVSSRLRKSSADFRSRASPPRRPRGRRRHVRAVLALARAASVAADPQFQAAAKRHLLLQSEAAAAAGLVATVVYNDSVLWSGGFRLRTSSSPRAAAASDLVRIASITKAYTMRCSTSSRRRHRRPRRRAVDAPARFSMRNPYSTAGCDAPQPREPPRRHPRGYPGRAPSISKCAESDVLENLRSLMPVSPPNRRFHYSNLGIACSAARSRTPPRRRRPRRRRSRRCSRKRCWRRSAW